MEITAILSPERTFRSLAASSKKKAIELAAETISGLDSRLEIGEVYRGLIEREKIGTTAIGNGVAIPHCRLKSCAEITGALFVFDEAVDFAAYDDEPVNIMFVLLVPESETNEHLKTLAVLAERCESADYRDSLVDAKNDLELFNEATSPPPLSASTAQN